MITLLWLAVLLVGVCLSRMSQRGGLHEEYTAYGPDESTVPGPVELLEPELVVVPAGYRARAESGRRAMTMCVAIPLHPYQPRAGTENRTLPDRWQDMGRWRVIAL